MKKSSKISLCGMMCALSVVFMFLTGVFPYATYALPALAGLTLIVLVVETSKKWAFIAYLAISLISLLVAPDRMAALLFILFFGYYPIVKSVLETKCKRVPEWIWKLVLFNAAVVVTYCLMELFVSMEDFWAMFGKYGVIGVILGILLGIIIMIGCDVVVQRKFNRKTKNQQKSQLLKTGMVVSIGLALHNFPEGLAIGSGFGASLTLGYSLAIAICLHDIPEGISMAVPMKNGGMPAAKVIFYVILSGITTGIGAFFGAIVGGISKEIIALCLSFAAGAMLYIVSRRTNTRI